MLHAGPPHETVHVLVATPSGEGGKGGIDRIMDALRGELADNPAPAVSVSFAATRGRGHVLVSPFFLALFCLRMIRDRLLGRLDVLHINLASNGSTWRKLVIAALARLLGLPYVIHLHGADYHNYWNPARPNRARLIRAMFEGAARVIVLGRFWRDFVAGMAPGVAGRIVIVPNAVARPVLQRQGNPDAPHILFLGRIGARKGVPELGRALAGLSNLSCWRATIAGDGEVEAARRAAADMGIADRVALPGWVDAPRVAELIADADILVLPSYEENLPMSVIEGMAAGLAVVATPVGAVEDIVTDGETGLLVPPGDAIALEAALRRLVTDGPLREKLGANAEAVHRARLDIRPYAQTIGHVWRTAARTRLGASADFSPVR